MPKCALGLGSNLGNREQYLMRAIFELEGITSGLVISKICETKPWGYQDQPDFLNLVAVGETEATPFELLDQILKIERYFGRVRNIKYGPRTIDIDILRWGDLILASPKLEIPHPRAAIRSFVLQPWAELEPSYSHPILRKTLQELFHQVCD